MGFWQSVLASLLAAGIWKLTPSLWSTARSGVVTGLGHLRAGMPTRPVLLAWAGAGCLAVGGIKALPRSIQARFQGMGLGLLVVVATINVVDQMARGGPGR